MEKAPEFDFTLILSTCRHKRHSLRMNARKNTFYPYYDIDEELKEVAEKILKAKPERVYVFFNNNHAMIENTRRMQKIVAELT